MWITKTNLIVYCSHFLSCWGNRMWMFGMGMFLVKIAGDTLQLSAVYGLVTGIAIFFFGALVGDWVDNTPRLKAAQLSLILQDGFMLMCAAVITTYLWYQDSILSFSTWLSPLLKAAIIFLGVLSNLAAQARVIAVERDWIVEICGDNRDHLASLTAMLRRIDQVSMILAPMATGQVMTFIGLVYGGLFIGGWNVVSVFVEFYLMWKVYNTVPALKDKKSARRIEDTSLEQELKTVLTSDDICPTTTSATSEGNEGAPNGKTSHDQQRAHFNGGTQEQQQETAVSPLLQGSSEPHTDPAAVQGGGDEEGEKLADVVRKEPGNGSAAPTKEGGDVLPWVASSRLLYQLVTLYRGWKTFASYSVAMAGVALSLLYMTVLGFDNITVAYAVTQGMTESVLGILMGSAAVFGIIGTFAYPLIRRRAGLVPTGFIALSCQVSCLTLCVLSVWMPGSPFDPLYKRGASLHVVDCPGPGVKGNGSSQSLQITTPADLDVRVAPLASVNGSDSVLSITATVNNDNFTLTVNNNCTEEHNVAKQGPTSYMSVGFLMGGIFLSRFGLWIADLTITQLFLEKVAPNERGIVNGVQSSLNQLIDLLKFALVVALPDTQTFGFLIIGSFSFIFSAWCLYTVFAKRERAKLCVCCGTTTQSASAHVGEGAVTEAHRGCDPDTTEK